MEAMDKLMAHVRARPIELMRLKRRVPPAFFHGVIKNRFDYLLKLVKEFKVDGVVWYSLMYRDSYDRECIPA